MSNDFANAPRRQRATGNFVFGKRRCQCNRTIEARKPTASRVILRLCVITIIEREFPEMIINFARPRRMRRFVRVLNTPGEFGLRSFSLTKESRQLGTNYPGDPVHHENIAAR